MHKNKYYRAPKPSTLPQKYSNKPKPEWTTDFQDREKYKLSESEAIQRKAALQSKNRQVARQDLEERRKKLQMGIVDEDTRKVYETALTSKRIDLNPSIRKYVQENYRNLSQMIQYERQQQQQAKQIRRKDVENSEEEDEDNYEEEVKHTTNFIKKLDRAKKQTNIERAIDILIDEKKSSHFGPTKKMEESSNLLKNLKESEIKNEDPSQSCEETLSNIEETIKFMEEKLFNPNWKKTKPASQVLQTHINKQKIEYPEFKNNKNNVKIQEVQHNNFISEVQEEESQQISYNQFLSDGPKKINNHADFYKFKLNLEENSEEDDECLSTIRRMKDMIESKTDLYCPEPSKSKENMNFSNSNNLKGFSSIDKMSEGDAEVDFSLTMNEDDPSFKVEEAVDFKKGKKNWPGSLSNYQELKKNLFDEVDQLQNYTYEQNSSSNFYSKNYQSDKLSYDDENNYDIPQIAPQPMVKKKKPKTSSGISSNFQHIKSLIEGSKSNVQKIQVEPIATSKGSSMMGFDYRGSINIKKNISAQPQY